MHKCNECGEQATYRVPEDIQEDISSEESYWCYEHAQKTVDARLIVHWPNPWRDVVYVPIEELAECALGIGKSWGDYTVNPPTSFIMTKEIMLEHWVTVGGRFPKGEAKLDAYILPCSSGFHSIGIRYGASGEQYLSPAGDQEKVAALLQKYQEDTNGKV